MYLSFKDHLKCLHNRKGILLCIFTILTINAFTQGYNFRNFTSENGLTQSYVYSIIQDEHGFLWIGTGNGLSKYNGFIFKNFTTSDSLADNFITCGISDGECLWFGHMNGGLSFYDGKKFHSVSMPQSGLSPLTHFIKSPDGRIWAGTYSEGLLNLDKYAGVVKRYLFKDKIFIISFDFLDDSELLVATNAGVLYCRLKESGEIEIIRSVPEIPDTRVNCIQKMRNGSGFYIATENDGIFKLTNKDKLLKVSKIIADPDFEFAGIQDIYEDSHSNLWLSSFGKGLIKMIYSDSGELTGINYFNTSNGFASDNVKTVYEDMEGNIWSGNYGKGLTQITPKTFSVFTFDDQLYGNEIFSIFLNQDYRWLGTENGLVKMDQLTDKIVKFYGKGSGLPRDTVNSIYSSDGEDLWVGTEKNGVFRKKPGDNNFIKYPVGSGALENSVNAIAGKGKDVWIGTKKGLCYINSDTGSIKWYSINQGGLPHNFISCLFIDRKDRLWISTHSNTLAYIQNEKVFKIPFNSLSGILTITEDSDSHIWVGSNGNGVFKIEADSIVNITSNQGLLSDYCYSIICGDNETVWVGHKDGLSRIRTSDFSVKPYQHIEGIPENLHFNQNALNKDNREKIWFGSDNGLVVYDPSLEYPRFLPPVLGITSIKINDEEKDITDKLILSPGNYKIRIDFLGISLKEPELVTYQYKLDGYDQWSEITKSNSITYPRLNEGNYTFILKASSGDGVITDKPLTVNIFIKVPVWKKWWFYPVTLLVLLLLTFIYIKRREYRFIAEKRILEEKVRERTSEIQSQKNEIELQRDLINEKNASITSSIRYARHIQNAVLPPIDHIDKLIPENFILSKPKDIVSGDFYWLTERDNKIFIAVADCTGHGVPGAFMSLLGLTFLNEIVNFEGITRSVDILTRLRERVINSLKQSRKDAATLDGMDIALCVFDHDRKIVQYTGGMSDIVYIREGELNVIKADRYSVCAFYGKTGPFTLKEIEYRKGDVFYMFSDGYQDQFGGENDKKFLIPHFRLTLLEIHQLPMSEQREVLETKLLKWMKDAIQTDDITVIGIRL